MSDVFRRIPSREEIAAYELNKMYVSHSFEHAKWMNSFSDIEMAPSPARSSANASSIGLPSNYKPTIPASISPVYQDFELVEDEFSK